MNPDEHVSSPARPTGSPVQINGPRDGHTRSATVAPGSLIFTAGAAPVDEFGATVAPGNVSEQARQCMVNLETALSEAGASLADVAKVTVFVAEHLQADLVVAWDVVTEFFGDHRPAGSLLGVSVLAYDDQLVEIEAVAAVPA
ncbi:RidA family protein [Gordonia sp. zg691]|uniref:RidA family protein n=1 Tax=Gordonia jinghuaiqii TaxID=2758710 RepID=A0A7D7QH03_9ACTN|nr:Rid family hydrolase [Gordonia jinghuaiqii]MBD0861665.1 RidA family protein [Gordonia jinghuaiqii]MCR5977557.1 RidA family protein [Gordonia jinghuaiqii]QMT02242.1 RidA family protein [Gordonia jinghuaiqii]